MTDLMRYLPDFWQDIVEMQAIQNAMNTDMDTLKNGIVDLLDQCFVHSATWGLKLWEKELGIITNESLSYEVRRAAILNKLQGTATSTIERIKQISEKILGVPVVVVEDNGKYRFEVVITGITGNKAALFAALEECKPAHLDFGLRLRGMTWGAVKNQTWGYYKDVLWFRSDM